MTPNRRIDPNAIMAALAGFMGAAAPRQAPQIANQQWQGIQNALAQKREERAAKAEKEQLKLDKDRVALTKQQFDIQQAKEDRIAKAEAEKARREKEKYDLDKKNNLALNYLSQNLPSFVEKYGTEVFYPANVGKLTTGVNEFLKEGGLELPDAKVYEAFNKLVSVAPPSKLVLQRDPLTGRLAIFRQDEKSGEVKKIADQFNGLFEYVEKNQDSMVAMDQAIKAIDEAKSQLPKGAVDYQENLRALNDLQQIAKKRNEFNIQKNQTKGAVPTDIDDYVDRAKRQYMLDNNGTEPSPGWLNKKALEFKRAQADEAGQVRLAQRLADSNTAQQIKFNETIGNRLAEIQTNASLIESKGEITPVQKKSNAKIRMEGNLAKLANHFLDLDSMGAIVNVDNFTFENITASMKASDVGQFLGRVTGTNAQSIRESIKKIKPLLIQDIRQSTDMSARGLDSEKELEFYLNAATNEKSDIQSNIAAIVVLDEAFGNGKIAQQLRQLTNESLVRRVSTEGQKILGGKSGKSTGNDLDQFWEK